MRHDRKLLTIERRRYVAHSVVQLFELLALEWLVPGFVVEQVDMRCSWGAIRDRRCEDGVTIDASSDSFLICVGSSCHVSVNSITGNTSSIDKILRLSLQIALERAYGPALAACLLSGSWLMY